MYQFHPRKLVSIVAIIVAAALLTVIGSVVGALFPTGSAVGSVLSVIPLGILVVAVLMCFHWVLDHWADSPTTVVSNSTTSRRALTRRFTRPGTVSR